MGKKGCGACNTLRAYLKSKRAVRRKEEGISFIEIKARETMQQPLRSGNERVFVSMCLGGISFKVFVFDVCCLLECLLMFWVF